MQIPIHVERFTIPVPIALMVQCVIKMKYPAAGIIRR
jgi:hypothetical protein